MTNEQIISAKAISLADDVDSILADRLTLLSHDDIDLLRTFFERAIRHGQGSAEERIKELEAENATLSEQVGMCNREMLRLEGELSALRKRIEGGLFPDAVSTQSPPFSTPFLIIKEKDNATRRFGQFDGRDWQEDFSHENGSYENICNQCGTHFFGHKRRVICKTCVTLNDLEDEP